MKDAINASVGKWLLEKGHTKTDLAESTGISVAMLTNKLQGETKWFWHEVCAISDVIGVSLDDLHKSE